MLGEHSGSRAVRRTNCQCGSDRVVTLSEAKGPEVRRISRLLSLLRSVTGMPDYERHLEHLRRFHPERTIPTRREYFQEYLKTRYQEGPTRCC